MKATLLVFIASPRPGLAVGVYCEAMPASKGNLLDKDARKSDTAGVSFDVSVALTESGSGVPAP